MKIAWQIDKDDIDLIKEFIRSQSKKSFVNKRVQKNTGKQMPDIDRSKFWYSMIACQITTQQKSGPGSAVNRFLCNDPFLLQIELCEENRANLAEFVEQKISNFGGLRRSNKIGQEAVANLRWLDNGGWDNIENQIEELKECRKRTPQLSDIPIERNAAKLISDNMKGFGPKQSRNIWQLLGLTRYEIPIDSRITKWLNRNRFPLKLSAGALQDPNYYNLVMDGIQQLCTKSNILPCVLDASIFASFDQEWSEDELIW